MRVFQVIILQTFEDSTLAFLQVFFFFWKSVLYDQQLFFKRVANFEFAPNKYLLL